MHISHQIIKNADFKNADGSITLDYQSRSLRRKSLMSDQGETIMVELPEVVSLESGDGFILDDGRVFIIKAKPEALLRIEHENLARVAWHIGNRHVPCEVGTDFILIQEDHVLADMLKKLGAKLQNVEAIFNPEGGAYGIGRTHSHD